ncbi:MAG TPA: type IIA DNA topoisomerase subunit B [Candidatus Protoclostridium stercorigallinarum]|uniref:DNA topoisomerase (ATP-hydrolyzing) n=1 Tax=Candidatus Protoclostridium stercorigallinarum TaxID=2838741 RepID=A0A9D1PZN3_9FIRM|nr:type IIA DNA topoisomerase subunit B [Candidatus Protoclostridium stercorigallinarum]
MSKDYKAQDIQVLEGLDAVRLRPGMYIGSTGAKGLHHILWEIVDNSMDEIANGYGDRIEVTIHSDGSASVLDNGRGIPVDVHPTLGVSGVEVVFTKLHAGGKFNNENYKTSGGLHGVGASVTNALSSWLNVEVYKDGKVYRAEFESRKEGDSWHGGCVKIPLFETGEKTDKHGTYVRFLPDKNIFDTTVFNLEVISKKMKELAFLNDGVHIVLTDERVVTNNIPLRREYCYTGGISDFVAYLNETKNPLHPDPIYLDGEKDNVYMKLALQYTDTYSENIFSYVNNIPTPEGGMHETGFKTALTRALNDLARKTGVLKDKDENLIGDDYRVGLTAVLAIKMQNVQFEGQTKTKLGNPFVRQAMDALVYQKLTEYLEAHPDVLDIILKKGMSAAREREAVRKGKEQARLKNQADNFNLVGKLASCTGKKPERNELYIVEGDSAGGTCKQARDRSFQAILPLRGKPLNAEKKRIDQVLQNEEIRTIISALGAGIGDDFNLDNLNYHKVVILSDADQDGGHIRAILLTFFFRYMKQLITDGHLYIGMPPLYKVAKKDVVEYVYNDELLDACKARMGRGCTIQRYKGLGEMNAEQLWETTMDPKRRTLMQVTLEDAAEAEVLVTTWMGDSVDLRRSYIIEHANFNKVDEFVKEAARAQAQS